MTVANNVRFSLNGVIQSTNLQAEGKSNNNDVLTNCHIITN